MIQNCFLLLGPLLTIKLNGHSMVKLGNGQAIIGGNSGWQNNYQNKIYLILKPLNVHTTKLAKTVIFDTFLSSRMGVKPLAS